MSWCVAPKATADMRTFKIAPATTVIELLAQIVCFFNSESAIGTTYLDRSTVLTVVTTQKKNTLKK